MEYEAEPCLSCYELEDDGRDVPKRESKEKRGMCISSILLRWQSCACDERRKFVRRKGGRLGRKSLSGEVRVCHAAAKTRPDASFGSKTHAIALPIRLGH